MKRRTRKLVAITALISVLFGVILVMIYLLGRARWENWHEWRTAIVVIPLILLSAMTSLVVGILYPRRPSGRNGFA